MWYSSLGKVTDSRLNRAVKRRPTDFAKAAPAGNQQLPGGQIVAYNGGAVSGYHNQSRHRPG
ncbi:hypothetical protein JN10_2620 [Altererythrobacter ishigakiensis]|uniref:Uncharacterized protein n=1 Tax=Altererythrobacter ishigakiensis TaxID=476157 RepID=A0A562UN75_9SPHN|nr:hypothetical protein JN10_2620 [Altererythrobacter ishigakiensis]